MADCTSRRKKLKVQETTQDLPHPIAVLADKYGQQIQLTEVIAAPVLDCKQLSCLMRQFKEYLPLNELTHVKRVKRDDQGNYAIVVCLSKHLPVCNTSDPVTIQQWIQSQPISWNYLGKPYLVKVASTPALTRQQFEIAAKYWPLSFYEDKRISAAINQTLLNSEEIQKIYNYMNMALSVALENSATGKLKIGAIIVDPSCDKVLAKTPDGRSANVANSILQHAVMACIDDIGKIHVAAEKSSNCSKLPKEDVNNKHCNQYGYLCTGYDLCAMALVHSRIKRVFYGVEDKQYGALGSRYKLHAHDGLNHHFEVYKNIYRDRCLEIYK